MSILPLSRNCNVVGAPFPPRPKAIATFLSSEDFLPGCQTLLYSVKKHLPPIPADEYPPDLIVLLSSKIPNSSSTVKSLRPVFCTRIIKAEHISLEETPDASDDTKSNDDKEGSHVDSWNKNCGWTKLRIFELDSYDTILYIDADCVVVKDVSHLLHIDRRTNNLTTVPQEEENEKEVSECGNDRARKRRRIGLLAAAPDIFPPDKFNAGVMVIRPSREVFRDMIASLMNTANQNKYYTVERRSDIQAKGCKSYDGGDTGFLNAYYPNWYHGMPSYSRLPFGYNAQRFMHHCTYNKQPKYWDEGIEQLWIVHFSSSPKPWETRTIQEPESQIRETMKKSDVSAFLCGTGSDKIEKISQVGKLELMWQTTYENSQKYCLQETKKQNLRRYRASSQSTSPTGTSSTSIPNRKNPLSMVQTRFKQLRKAGMNSKEAMAAARAEYGLDQMERGMNPSRAVGQMFGLA